MSGISFSRRSPERTIALNMLAEFFGSGIFSALYFIFIGRHLAEGYDMSFLILSYAVGLAFFAAVFIPFHTYRIHIIPFITIITALRKSQWRVLWHKIPAQMAGAFAGTFIFHRLDSVTTMGHYPDLLTVQLSDPLLLAFLNGMVAAVLCYAFFVIRILFKQRRSTGTIFISLLIASLFLVTGKIAGISALNPFGHLAYEVLTGEHLFFGSWALITLTHLILPVTLSVAAFYFVREIYGGKGVYRRKHRVVAQLR
jgi:glycerol uptake facilitator-like aquaporin